VDFFVLPERSCGNLNFLYHFYFKWDNTKEKSNAEFAEVSTLFSEQISFPDKFVIKKIGNRKN
jgi:hypothetical protein